MTEKRRQTIVEFLKNSGRKSNRHRLIYKYFNDTDFYHLGPLLIGLALGEPCSNIIDYQSVWDEGSSGTIHAKFPETTSSWHMTVTFDSPITDFEVYVGGKDTEKDFNF